MPIFRCPRCGVPVYPDEVSCTNCRFIVRTFCSQCDALVQRNQNKCPQCGAINEKYDPSLVLMMFAGNGIESGNHGQPVSGQMAGASEIVTGATGMDGLDAEPPVPGVEGEFDEENFSIASEIQRLKKELRERPGGNAPGPTFVQTHGRNPDSRVDARNILVDSFTMDYDGFRRGTKDISEQSTEEMLKEPVVDEVHLLIKSMNIEANSDEYLTGLDFHSLSPDSEERLVAAWDGNAFLYTPRRVLVGFGSGIDRGMGIPGMLFITRSLLVFFSYNDKLAGVDRVFSYFDVALQSVVKPNYSVNFAENYLVLKPHGVFQRQFPSDDSITLNFTWSLAANEESLDSPYVQDKLLLLQGAIQHARSNPGKLPFIPGKAVFSVGKSITDPIVRNFLGELEVKIPRVAASIKARFPELQ